jgi:hypothetical protein
MRFATSRLAAGISLLTFALAGCGGAAITAQEAPGDPVQMTVPGNAAALAPNLTPSPTATPSASVDASAAAATPTPAAGAAATAPPQGTTGGGTAAPDTGAAAPTPAPGSGNDEFEAFCAENPGAC